MHQNRKQLRLDLTNEPRVVEKEATQEKKNTQRSWQAISIALSLGTSMCIPIIVAAWVGHYIDGKIHTSPVVTLISLGLGVIISIRSVYTQLKKFL
jgi:F0F1-type ATP synthase assembly protein I